MEITRAGTERLFDFAFRLARQRKRRRANPAVVTCVDKANVFASMAFFRGSSRSAPSAFPDIAADHAYVDAMALNLVRKPWEYDVLVTENMFGDILSDLAAGMIGGMGMAPSADIGDKHALFQPAHGTAPDIAGKGKANPTAMILSAAMMLDWLAVRDTACRDAAEADRRAPSSMRGPTTPSTDRAARPARATSAAAAAPHDVPPAARFRSGAT